LSDGQRAALACHFFGLVHAEVTFFVLPSDMPARLNFDGRTAPGEANFIAGDAAEKSDLGTLSASVVKTREWRVRVRSAITLRTLERKSRPRDLSFVAAV
jgi:hypothetical protein